MGRPIGGSLGPVLVSGNFTDLWIDLAAPILGALAAVGSAWILRRPSGGISGTAAAQGTLRGDRQQMMGTNSHVSVASGGQPSCKSI